AADPAEQQATSTNTTDQPTSDSLGAQPTAQVARQVQAPATDPAPAAPSLRPISGLLSVVTLGTTLIPNAPTEPADMPGVWAVMAWVRRQPMYSDPAMRTTVNPQAQLPVPTVASAVLDPTQIVNWLIYQP